MIFIIENKGQGSVEFLFIISIALILVLTLSNFLANDNDLNLAISAAKSGMDLGADGGRLAIYEDDAYTKYTKENILLTHPNSIKIVKIETLNRGYDTRYNKTSIQIRVYASSPSLTSRDDRVSAGDRITYNLRKSITMAFNTEKLTNSLYNPCFSKKHVFTTANVQWI
jgi:class III signal peptide